MKKFFLTLVTFSVLFVIGCQENPITDPVTIEPTNKVQPIPFHQGTITLERMLTDPYPVMNSYYIINGGIEYEYRLEFSNSVPAIQQYSLSLNLNITAGLTYLCTVCDQNDNDLPAGYISDQSDDTITLTDNDRFYIEKSYHIQGRDDGMLVMCRFLVTTQNVSLADIYLVLPEIES